MASSRPAADRAQAIPIRKSLPSQTPKGRTSPRSGPACRAPGDPHPPPPASAREPPALPPAAPAALPWPAPVQARYPLPKRPVPPAPQGSARSTGRAAPRLPRTISQYASVAEREVLARLLLAAAPRPSHGARSRARTEIALSRLSPAAPRKLAPKSLHECLQLPHPIPYRRLLLFRHHQGMSVRIVGKRKLHHIARHGLVRRRRRSADLFPLRIGRHHRPLGAGRWHPPSWLPSVQETLHWL